MSHDSVRATITLIHGQIEKLQTEINAHKKTINSLCEMIGDQPPYNDTDQTAVAGKMVTRSDEFYGKKFATVVRTILERRQRANLGAASVPDIYKIMTDGSYQFEAKNTANAQRGMHIALAKNSTTFHRLPNGNYGLREWYPAIKERSKPEADNGDSDQQEVAASAAKSEDKPAADRPLHEELQQQQPVTKKRERFRMPAK